MNTVQKRLPRYFVAGIAALALLVVPEAATATTQTYCGYFVSSGEYCPTSGGGAPLIDGYPRHTFLSNKGTWNASAFGCDVSVIIKEFVAYTSSNGSSPKYEKSQCNEAFIYHPYNTDLLRQYVQYSSSIRRLLDGIGAY